MIHISDALFLTSLLSLCFFVLGLNLGSILAHIARNEDELKELGERIKDESKELNERIKDIVKTIEKTEEIEKDIHI